MKCFTLLSVSLLAFIVKADDDDYWADDFDENKNCVREKEMRKLQRETEPARCSSSTIGKEHKRHFIFYVQILHFRIGYHAVGTL